MTKNPSVIRVCTRTRGYNRTYAPSTPLIAPAVANALVDALSHLGVRHVEMPATPERMWRAIKNANDRQPRAPE